jgi:hypothetical protein
MSFKRYIVEEDPEKIIWMDWNWNKHREGDLPAIEYKDGTKIWYMSGVKHRDNGLPAVIFPDGHQEWWVDGKLHREEGPAIIRSEGRSFYFKDGVEYLPEGEDLS